MKLPLPHVFELQETDRAAATATLPESAGIYALSLADVPPHISWSVNLRRRLTRLLIPSASGKADGKESPLAKYRDRMQAIEYWPTGSRLEVLLLLYELTKTHYPTDYRKRLHLRLPWFLGFLGADPFPRLEVSNRISRKYTQVFGPFLNRDQVQRYEQEVLGLFQIRRCIDALQPHAEHPGCIYGEMNQCLRPCQCAVTAEEYASESRRVTEFLATNGKSDIGLLSAVRERASAEMDFEQAAQIHKRLERVQAASSCREDVIAAVDVFSGVALTRGLHRFEFRLWPVAQGFWQEPVILNVSSEEGQTKSLDGAIRESLSHSLERLETKGERAEQLAIFSRWYYSSWRDGQWFPFRTLADLNYRKLVREISLAAKDETVFRK